MTFLERKEFEILADEFTKRQKYIDSAIGKLALKTTESYDIHTPKPGKNTGCNVCNFDFKDVKNYKSHLLSAQHVQKTLA
jgi:Zinc-finger of C2H2 type